MAVAQLTVCNLDEDIIRRLEQRAAAHGRSPEEEHRLLLRQALRPERFADALRAIPAVGDDADVEFIDELPRGIGF